MTNHDKFALAALPALLADALDVGEDAAWPIHAIREAAE